MPTNLEKTLLPSIHLSLSTKLILLTSISLILTIVLVTGTCHLLRKRKTRLARTATDEEIAQTLKQRAFLASDSALPERLGQGPEVIVWGEPYIAQDGADPYRPPYHIPRSLKCPARMPVVRKPDVVRCKQQRMPYGRDMLYGRAMPCGLAIPDRPYGVDMPDRPYSMDMPSGLTDYYLPDELRAPAAVKKKRNKLQKPRGGVEAKGKKFAKGGVKLSVGVSKRRLDWIGRGWILESRWGV